MNVNNSVWYVSPFEHPEYGHVTADTIRKSLGNFYKIEHQPSKLAARFAQAFTATEASVSITPDQWMECEDLGEEPYREFVLHLTCFFCC